MIRNGKPHGCPKEEVVWERKFVLARNWGGKIRVLGGNKNFVVEITYILVCFSVGLHRKFKVKKKEYGKYSRPLKNLSMLKKRSSS